MAQPPIETLRDLIGITRALYLERKGAGAGPDELLLIEHAGKALSLALRLTGADSEMWAEQGLIHLTRALEASGDVGAYRLVAGMGARLR